jgi:hypothetical protein
MIINKESKAQLPTGKTSGKWYSEGYRAALLDIAKLVDTDASYTNQADRLDKIREWIENNSRLYFD